MVTGRVCQSRTVNGLECWVACECFVNVYGVRRLYGDVFLLTSTFLVAKEE